MRRNIFKGEFEYLCNKLDIGLDCKFKLIFSIFNGTPNDSKEYYEIKEELYDYTCLMDVISSIIGQVEKTWVIKNVFTISSDLNYIPINLLTEIKLKNVAVFVGAGLSKVVSDKYPLWDELANRSIKFLYDKGKINFFEKERLIREIADPKQKLSIFEKYIGGNKSQEYKEFLNQNFSHEKDSQTSNENPYHILCSEIFNFIKVTSNVDLEFICAYSNLQGNTDSLLSQIENRTPTQEKKWDKPESFMENTNVTEDFRYDKIYMIHGNILDYKNTVFTTDDYIKEYFSVDGKISKFLEKLFQNYTVLFIGYGLSEFPILERIISSGGKRHYVLLPTFLSEINYFQKQASYLEKLNITALPYYLDSEGYNRINSVLKNWEKIIAKRPIDTIKIIDDFLIDNNGNQ